MHSDSGMDSGRLSQMWMGYEQRREMMRKPRATRPPATSREDATGSFDLFGDGRFCKSFDFLRVGLCLGMT